MLSFPRPLVVACTGHAYAMGAFLLLAADHRIGLAGTDHVLIGREGGIERDYGLLRRALGKALDKARP